MHAGARGRCVVCVRARAPSGDAAIPEPIYHPLPTNFFSQHGAPTSARRPVVAEMADRKDEINAWLSEHGVEQAIAGAVDSAVRAQAADPIQHIADALSKSESGEVATLRKANEE